MKPLQLLLLIAMSVLVSCNQQAPVLVNVRAKDMNRTGDRYYEDWEKLETRTVGNLNGYSQENIPRGRYNDRTDITLEKTGFYYTKKVDGQWWAVSPDGHPLISIGVNSLNMYTLENWQEEMREKYDTLVTWIHEAIPVPGSRLETMREKYGTIENWIDETIPLLEEYGFYGAGSWVDEELVRSYNERHDAHFFYCPQLDILPNYINTLDKKRGYPVRGKLFPIFEKDFEEYCAARAGTLEKYKDDPNLFGYFLDNELTFSRDLLDEYLTLPEDDTGYVTTINWLADKGLDADGPFTDQVRDAFRVFVLERYLSVTTKAIREVDPNHMILGSRFYWNDRIYFNDNQSGMLTNPMVFRTAGKYVDVLSCNYYFRWTPVPEEINAWTEWSGRPFMMTEWYVKGEDSGLANEYGAGWIVGTQEERGLFYQNYTLALLESPNCIGWHWFRYQDESVIDSPRSSNKGLVDYDFQPYYDALNEMKEVNDQVYSLRDYFSR